MRVWFGRIIILIPDLLWYSPDPGIILVYELNPLILQIPEIQSWIPCPGRRLNPRDCEWTL